MITVLVLINFSHTPSILCVDISQGHLAYTYTLLFTISSVRADICTESYKTSTVVAM